MNLASPAHRFLYLHYFGLQDLQVASFIRSLGVATLVNLALFGLVFTFATPCYETNDDLTMQLVSSGFYTGHPSEYLVFTSFVIGWVLKILYSLHGGLNWYFLYLVSVHFLALTAIAALAWNGRRTWSRVALYVGLFLLVEVRLLLNLQFTSTAFLAGTAGILLLVHGLTPDGTINWAKLLAGLAFIVLAVMIREPVVPLLGLIATPFVIERLTFAGWRRMGAMALLCAAALVLVHTSNQWYYRRSPGWSTFVEYNQLRGKIHRTSLEKSLPIVASQVGWSANDASMFSGWYFPDPDVYASLPGMQLLVTKLENRSAPTHFPRFQLFLPNLLGGDSAVLMKLALLNLVWCLVAAGPNWRRWLVCLLITYAVCLLLANYLVATARLPQRLAITMPVFFHVICLYYAGVRPGSSALAGVLNPAAWRLNPVRLRLVRYSGLGLILLWTGFYASFSMDLCRSIRAIDASHRELRAISGKIFEPIRGLLPGRKPVLVTMPFDHLLEQCFFFWPATATPPCAVVPYGWLTHSPLFNEILKQTSLNPYSLSVLDNASVFFLMEPRWIAPLTAFYQEHYQLPIKCDLVLNTDGDPTYHACRLHVYQLHSIENETRQKPNHNLR